VAGGSFDSLSSSSSRAVHPEAAPLYVPSSSQTAFCPRVGTTTPSGSIFAGTLSAPATLCRSMRLVHAIDRLIHAPDFRCGLFSFLPSSFRLCFDLS
jgi:hypothetical protein